VNDAYVELRKVGKSFGDTTVIEGISLQVPRNLTTALVGESGSGKSTLLQIINGLVVPDTGEVWLDGQPIDYSNLPRLRRRMGYAAQGGGLFPHLTVEHNVTLMAKLEGWSSVDVRARYEYLLGLLELPADLSERFPHSLSGGQQQRVSLCRAMMLNPPLMLLDEPFSALDPITRKSIHTEFLQLQRAESRSIILVTHDMSEALKLAQHLVILKKGGIVQQGEVDAVRKAPANDYVARLFAGAEIQ
jgi:osmoprotectant transport system ATP-binding protein